MSFLLRVLLPDRPGSLGAVATAIGLAGGDIVSLDVVERGPDGAVDDLVVELTAGHMADVLITAATSVDGVLVESLRPYHGGGEIHRDLDMVDELAAAPRHALAALTATAPGVFRAGWALLVEQTAAGHTVVHASAAAPDTDHLSFPWLPLATPARLDTGEAWAPERWRTVGMELVAVPVGRADRVLLVGRPGGPRFRTSEVLRLAHLCGIATTVAGRG